MFMQVSVPTALAPTSLGFPLRVHSHARVPALARQVSRKSCSPTSRNLIPPGQTGGSATPTHTYIVVGRFPCKGPTCPPGMNVTAPALLQLLFELA